MKIAREQNQQLAVGPVYLLAESDKTQKSSTTTFPLLVVSWLQALCLVPGARPSDSLGRPPWDDELRDVQPYLVQPDPVKCGRIAVWWPAAPARAEQPILIMMAIRWSRFLEEGSWRRPRVVLSNREGIPGEASGSADSEGRRLSPRPRHPRCYIRFPPFRVGDEG
jgi:hypothetical protein